MDVRIAQARHHHRESLSADGEAAEHRAQRNALIRRLREEDARRWTYAALAAAVNISPELVAAIVQRRTLD